MLNLIEFFGEVGSSFPYIYKVWGCVFNATYRKRVFHEYKTKPTFGVAFDLMMSLIFFSLELWLLFLVLGYVV